MCVFNLNCIIESYDVSTKKFKIIHNGLNNIKKSEELNSLRIPVHEFIESLKLFREMGFGVTVTVGGDEIIKSLKELLVFETMYTKLYISIPQKGFN